MEELSEIVKSLSLNITEDECVEYEYINVFKNPNKLPINQIHLEKTTIDLRRDAPLEASTVNIQTCFDQKRETVPALSKVWLPEAVPFFNYQPYHFAAEENRSFVRNNKLFLQSLHYLLGCNYHQFWCLVLFEPKVGLGLHSFLLNPIPLRQIKNLGEEEADVYLAVFSQFRRVYQRLTTFQETESEYMADSVGLKFLIDKKLLNLPIVLTLIVLYQETNLAFVNDLVSLYFNEKSVVRDKEIEEMVDQVLLTLDMIGGHVCGFESDAVIVPLAIEERPKVFQLGWVFSVVDYLLNTISTLHVLLKFYKAATEVALDKGSPYRLSYTYEKVFHNLYDYINERKELEENPTLSDIIYDGMALARSESIDVYNTFVSYCLDKTLECSSDPLRQQEFVETYLKLMTTALEDEYFICDYHERYDVGAQNEMFSTCTEIDQTRTDYILSCITSLRRHNRMWKTLKSELRTLNKAIEKYARSRKLKNETRENGIEKTETEDVAGACWAPPPEDTIEEAVKMIVDMLPHLGDGFVLQCLEAYNYETSDVISAILEQNLPPHLQSIPFDEIRIPPEPSPPEPILAYRGKKSQLDDALKLLNDKKDMKEIKTFILDGIQYTNEYDDYDDEYDDRQDDATVAVRDHGSEDILKYNPNYDEDVVSDTSYSENEYDDSGQRMAAPSGERSRGKGDFCEDPAAVRERMEAKRRARGQGSSGKAKPQPNPSQHRDVAGKPKGQGQDKNVLHNRQKKTVNKSSRANHNRKSGAQWKRNKGMMPI